MNTIETATIIQSELDKAAVETYEESYVGKIINDYDGKQMLVAAIGAYHKGLSVIVKRKESGCSNC